MIGSLRRVALREVWSHEARDFTTWLEENIDVLNDAIDLSLSIVSSEQAIERERMCSEQAISV